MRISTLALANLRRRPGKAGFLVAGIALAVGTAVALLQLSGAIRDEIGEQLDRFGANIVVTPRSNSLSLDYGGIAVAGLAFDAHRLTNEDSARIRDIPYRKRIAAIAPKLFTTARAEGKNVLLAGVDFPSELRLKRWWRIVGERPGGPTDLLVGYTAAEALSLVTSVTSAADHGAGHHAAAGAPAFRMVRDRIRLGDSEHRVAGVIAPTGGPEDRMVFASLPYVQQLAGRPGQLSLIEVSALCKDCPVGDILAQIDRQVPNGKASAIQQSVLARAETVDRLTRFSTAVAALVLGIAVLLIFTSMMGSVVERTREIGVLRALGFRRAHVIQGLLVEVAGISVAGGLAGWLGGMAAARVALPYFTAEAAFEVRPVLVAFALAVALGIGVAGSVYPALRAARLEPSEALRHV